MAFPARQQVDPKQLRPRRGWYAAAAAIGLLGVAAGFGLFIAGLISVFSNFLPQLGNRFATGETVTVDMTTGQRQTIYGQGNDLGTECAATGPGTGVEVGPTPYSFEFTVGGETWFAVADVHAVQGGTYTLTCRGPGEVYALGDSPQFGRFMGTLFGSILSLFAFPIVGLVTGGCIGLVVGLRRSSHRKELERQRFQSPPFVP